MKIYYVEYRYSETEWKRDVPFNDFESAEKYKNQLAMQAKAGVSRSLNGYTENDFRIEEVEL